jgi:hypothetical protein
MSTTPSTRRRGRTVGQVVAPYGSRPTDGDIIESSKLIGSHKDVVWT